MKRIFQIGFNKCATRSIAMFFSRNGVKTRHWARNELAINIARRRAAFEDPVADYPNVVLFTDMECVSDRKGPLIEAYKWFDYFHAWYPDAYFILNTRHVEDWIQSRLKHGRYLQNYRWHSGVEDVSVITERWRQDWYLHHYNVHRFFSDKPGRLLVFDIDRDGPRKLCDFVAADFSLDAALFGHEGKTASAPAEPVVQEQSD